MDAIRSRTRATATLAVVAVCASSAPLLTDSQQALSLMAQACIMAVLALSYNLLLGECGLLSFGHAIYSGLGAYAVIHLLQAIGQDNLAVPVVLLPLAGGLAGMLLGALIGYPTSRRGGTTFAMITFGLGELLYAATLMFPRISGGEAGISASRASGQPLFGIESLTLGPEIQVVYVVIAWTLAAIATLYALRQTPLLRVANAVRDNPMRAEFIGVDPQRVRWAMVVMAGFFAGLSGGLSAIYFEIATPESLGVSQSAAVLIATCIGGSASFIGPIIGSVVYVLFSVALSSFTAAWQFYMGALFLAVMMYAPRGIAGLASGRTDPRPGGTDRARRAIAALAVAAGGCALTELLYRLSATSLPARAEWISSILDPGRVAGWVVAAGLLAAGIAGLVPHRAGPAAALRTESE